MHTPMGLRYIPWPLLLALIAGAALADPAASHSVRDGVYTQAQARRGMAPYLKQCSGCHGETFRGGESSPTLLGADFMSRWNGKSLSDMFAKIRLMPPNEPGKLPVEQTGDVLAAILRANRLPAGEQELPSEQSDLTAIRIESAP